MITSPSMRREWIEMESLDSGIPVVFGLPPCGGSGLKWESDYVLHERFGLPPCGGSGLKCEAIDAISAAYGVSLHAEGVD